VHVRIQYPWRRNVEKGKGDDVAWRAANPLAGDLGERFVKALVGLAYRNDGQVARLTEKTYGP